MAVINSKLPPHKPATIHTPRRLLGVKIVLVDKSNGRCPNPLSCVMVAAIVTKRRTVALVVAQLCLSLLDPVFLHIVLAGPQRTSHPYYIARFADYVEMENLWASQFGCCIRN